MVFGRAPDGFPSSSPEVRTESPEVRRNHVIAGSASSQALLANGMPATPENAALRQNSMENAAQRWSVDMVSGTIPDIHRNALALKRAIMADPSLPQNIKTSVETMLRGIMQRCETAMKSNPPNAWPVFFALENLSQSLSTAPNAAPPLIQVPASIESFVLNSLNAMNPDRPETHRENYRGREVDKRIVMAGKVGLLVIGMGGFVSQGLIYFLGGKDPVTHQRLINPKATMLYAALAATPLIAGSLASEPGAASFVSAMRETQFLGTPGNVWEALGVHGPQWEDFARRVYGDRSGATRIANGRGPITPDERTYILSLASNDAAGAQLEQMIAAPPSGNPPLQPARSLFAMLLNARTLDAQEVVYTYFRENAGPQAFGEVLQFAEANRNA